MSMLYCPSQKPHYLSVILVSDRVCGWFRGTFASPATAYTELRERERGGERQRERERKKRVY